MPASDSAKLNLPSELKARYLQQPGLLLLSGELNTFGFEEMLLVCTRSTEPVLADLALASTVVANKLREFGVLGGSSVPGCPECKLSAGITLVVQLMRKYGRKLCGMRKFQQLSVLQAEAVQHLGPGAWVAWVAGNDGTKEEITL